MNDELLAELLDARRRREACALVTVAHTAGSVPRAAGAKMIVYHDGRISGTVGGGKFESLVIAEAVKLETKFPLLKKFTLREGEEDSFGAICGGEVTVLIEPQTSTESLFLIGAGHCSQAIAKLARACCISVTTVDDRADLLERFATENARAVEADPAQFIRSRTWQPDEALVIVSRGYQIDREALAAALEQTNIGYLGMIGSRRKVIHVFDELKARGAGAEQLQRVFAPIGLDIGADAPMEIAVSIIAEVLQVLRRRKGGHLRLIQPLIPE